MEFRGYSDFVLVDRLRTVVFAATGLGWTVWGAWWLCRLATGLRAVVCSGYSDWLLVTLCGA